MAGAMNEMFILRFNFHDLLSAITNYVHSSNDSDFYWVGVHRRATRNFLGQGFNPYEGTSPSNQYGSQKIKGDLLKQDTTKRTLNRGGCKL